MCLTWFATSFVVIAVILAVQLLTLCFGVTDKMKPMISSHYISSIAGVMFAYIINAFLLAVLVYDVYSKILMAAFGIVPFIIGGVVNYKKLKFYSIIQILCVISSGLYVAGL